jgi:benzoyl-CoA reductase/2-hydroxyglutaryl-CoA dehydratase subunit BcrC/BadD/HgdB
MPNLRLDFIKKTADGFGLQGVVVYNLSYCECRALENPLIKEKAKEWFNIPTLFLEGEYTDESLEECRGRIEAFVEMLEG